MGYRSDIVLRVDKAQYYAFILTNKIVDVEWLKSCVTNDGHEGGVVEICFEEVKWYSDYPEIWELEDWMSRMDAMVGEAVGGVVIEDELYGFIRLGEEFEDVERRGDPDKFGMWVNRMIERE